MKSVWTRVNPNARLRGDVFPLLLPHCLPFPLLTLCSMWSSHSVQCFVFRNKMSRGFVARRGKTQQLPNQLFEILQPVCQLWMLQITPLGTALTTEPASEAPESTSSYYRLSFFWLEEPQNRSQWWCLKSRLWFVEAICLQLGGRRGQRWASSSSWKHLGCDFMALSIRGEQRINRNNQELKIYKPKTVSLAVGSSSFTQFISFSLSLTFIADEQ